MHLGVDMITQEERKAMNLPEELLYSKDHEWLAMEGNNGVIGVTGYAIEQLGDIVHIELPSVGDEFEAGESFGTIESTKTVSDLYMPIAGQVIAVNKDIASQPESLQEDPYKNGWLIRVKMGGKPEGLLSNSQYEAFVQED
jgi:glycine cleavage system H protein